jgi:hypothetical protein
MGNGSVENLVRRADLIDAPGGEWIASGVFQFSGATYSVQFTNETGLLECLDLMMSRTRKPGTPRFTLRPRGWAPKGPEVPPSSLRFDFDRERDVAAAVCLVNDRAGNVHAWMTHGGAGRDDVVLTHDTWNPDDTRFPPESFVTVAQLRELVAQWEFGEVLPPPAAEWSAELPDEIGWF